MAGLGTMRSSMYLKLSEVKNKGPGRYPGLLYAGSIFIYKINIEIHQLNKLIQAFINIFFADLFQTFGSRFLYTETGHGAAVDDDGGFHVLKTDVPGFGQVTDKTSGKVSPALVGSEYTLPAAGQGKI